MKYGHGRIMLCEYFAARNFIMSNNMEILKQHLKTFVKAALTGGMGPNFSKLGITGECM